MAGSLQDQLLKAGIANKQQAKKATIDKRKQKKQAPEQAEAERQQRLDAIEAQRRDKAERDRQLNEARKAEQDKKAIDAQVKQLIERHQVKPSERADTRFQFVDGTTIKSLYVDADMLPTLARAQLRVARFGASYALIPAVVAQKIEARRPEVLIPLSSDQQASDEDDPYAEYVIPDDLMW